MEETTTLGSMNATVNERRIFAKKSHRWNRENNPKFKDVFPDLVSIRPTECLQSPTNTTNTADTNTKTVRGEKACGKEENDLIMTEISLLMRSGTVKMLLGGIVLYVIVYAVFSLAGWNPKT